MDCINFMTWNCDHNIGRLGEPKSLAYYTHRNWCLTNRMNGVIGTIKQNKPDLLHIQETRQFSYFVEIDGKKEEKVSDSLTPMIKNLEKAGYTVVEAGYNPSDKAFHYVTAFKNHFELLEKFSYYLTKTPNEPTKYKDTSKMTPEEQKEEKKRILDHNNGEEFEKSIFVVKLKDILSGKEFYSINVHLGITERHRLESSIMIKEFVKNLDTFFTPHENKKRLNIIMSGDFNSFPDWKGPEQMELLMKDALYVDITERYTYCDNNGESVNVKFDSPTSFVNYPYDFGKAEKILKEKGLMDWLFKNKTKENIDKIYEEYSDSIGGQLDHIFICGDMKSIMDPILQFTPTDNIGPIEYSNQGIKDFVLKMDREDKPAFWSDHQPMLAMIKL